VTDAGIPLGAPVYSNLRRAIMAILSLLVVAIAVLAWSAVKAQAEKPRCNAMLWKFVIRAVEPDFYAEKCGCPNNLDFHFSCNSQYLGLGLF
jgi:hypothetical protein